MAADESFAQDFSQYQDHKHLAESLFKAQNKSLSSPILALYTSDFGKMKDVYLLPTAPTIEVRLLQLF